MSKTGKNPKNPLYKKSVIFEKLKIDFKSTGCVPVSLQPLATITHAYFQLYMLSTKRNKYFVVNTSSRRRREGVQAHQYTQDTGTQRSTMRKQRKWREEPRGGRPQVFFFIPVFLLVNYYIYFNNISTNARQVIFRYMLVVQHLAPTAVTRYWCYRYRILPVTLY